MESKLAASEAILGDRVALVPYLKEMVPIYHRWLQDPHIMEMTCTEETTIESEYENQASYFSDTSKAIFLAVDLTATELPRDHPHEDLFKALIPPSKVREGCLPALAGDVNLFLGKESELPDPSGPAAEINIMIAEKGSQRKGLA